MMRSESKLRLHALFASICYVGQVESPWQLKVELYSRALMLPSNGVCEIHVDLWAVESSVSFVHSEGKIEFLKCTSQRVFCSEIKDFED